MSFKIGIPTLLELETLEKNVRLCNELGLKLVEISLTRPEFFPEALMPDELLEYSARYGMEFSLHLPEEIDFASFHDSIRNAYVERVAEILGWAARANIRIINMHLADGVYCTMPDRKVFLYDIYREKYIGNMKDSFGTILQSADANGQKICLENCGNFHYAYIREIIGLLEGTFLTWDTGHDAASGFRETEILLSYENRIAHMHLHDYSGESPHKELYTGNVPIDKMLDFAAKNNIGVIVEVKTAEALKRSIRKLHSNQRV